MLGEASPLLPEQSDEELLEMFQEMKNPDAIGELFQRYRPRLQRFLGKFLRDEESIQEVLQDTFLHLIERIDVFERGRKVSPWLFGIAKWTAMTYRKRMWRRKMQPLREKIVEDTTTKEEPVELSVMRSDFREILLRFIETLDEKQRPIAALLLDGFHPRAIARTLQLPWGTVQYRAQHVMTLLRQELGCRGYDACSLEQPSGKGGKRVMWTATEETE